MSLNLNTSTTKMLIEVTNHARQRYAERYKVSLDLGTFKDSLAIAYLSKKEEDVLLVGEQFLFIKDTTVAVVELTEHCLVIVTFLPELKESILARLHKLMKVWKVVVYHPTAIMFFVTDSQFTSGWPSF